MSQEFRLVLCILLSSSFLRFSLHIYLSSIGWTYAMQEEGEDQLEWSSERWSTTYSQKKGTS